jgi:hypothetical protein
MMNLIPTFRVLTRYALKPPRSVIRDITTNNSVALHDEPVLSTSFEHEQAEDFQSC